MLTYTTNRRRRRAGAAILGGRSLTFPETLPGAFALYDGDSMTLDVDNNIKFWKNRLGAAYTLTGATAPNEPIAVVNEAFNSRQCATFTGTQVATSATLKALFTGNAPFTAYFACQFERDETSAVPDEAYLFQASASGTSQQLIALLQRQGSGPYTYRLRLGKYTLESTWLSECQVSGLSGIELSSEKFYIGIANKASGGITAYVNTIANSNSQATWNDDTCTIDGTTTVGSISDGTRPSHGPIGGIYLYDQEHTTAQIQSMIEGWMPSYFGPVGDPIAAVRGMTYIGTADTAILSGTDITELPNEASLWEGWGYHKTADTSAIAASAKVPIPDSDWSLGGWMKNDELAQSLNWIYEQGQLGANSSLNIFYYGSGHANAGKVKCNVVDFESNPTDLLTATAAYGVTSWQHVLLTYDKSESELKIYMNGTLAGTQTVTLGALSTNTATFGDSGNTNPADYDGTLRQWAKWDSLLNIDQITLLAAGTTPDKVGTPAWHIPMTQATYDGGVIDGLTLTNTGVTGELKPK